MPDKELCFNCDNELKTISDVYTEKIDNKTIVIKNVPCNFCESCNEKYFDANVADNIEKIVEYVKVNDTENNKDVILVDYNTIIDTLAEITAVS